MNGVTTVSVVDSYLGHSKVLKYQGDNSGSYPSIMYSFPNSYTGTFTYSFWCCIDTTFGGGAFGNLFDVYDSGGNQGAAVGVQNLGSGDFWSYSISAGSWNTILPFSPNTWYWVNISASTTSQTFSAWVNGQVLCSNVQLKYSTNPLANFAMFGNDMHPSPINEYVDAVDFSYDPQYGTCRSAMDIGQTGTYNATQTFNQSPFTVPLTYLGQQWTKQGFDANFAVGQTWSTGGGTIQTYPAIPIAATPHQNVLRTMDSDGNYAGIYIGAGNAAGTITVEFWIYPVVSTSGAYVYASDDFSPGNNTSGWTAWHFFAGSGGDSNFYFQGGGSMAFSFETWYHVRLVADYTAHVVSTYVNGLLKDSNAAFSNTSVNSLNKLFIASRFTGEDMYWDAIDMSSDPSYSSGRSSYMLLNSTWSFSQAGNYSFCYALNDSTTNYPGTWTDFTVVNPVSINATTPTYVYLAGATGNILHWNITAPVTFSPTYAIYRNGTFQINSTWTSGVLVPYNIDSLPPNYYSVTIVATDGLGNISLNQVNVTVDDVPQVPPPVNLNYYWGQTGNSLSWTVTDVVYNATTYTVNRTGSQFAVATGSWSPGVPIPPVNVDGLAVGAYTFTCNVSDGFGGTNASTTIVTVLTHGVAITTATSTFVYLAGTTGNALQWNITDLATSLPTYIIDVNGFPEVNNHPWTSGVLVNYIIDGWVPGYYNVTIVANDGLGIISQNQINVIVDDVPQFTTATNLTFYAGQTGFTLNWTVLDTVFGTTTYTVTSNGTTVASGSWSPGVLIVVPLGNLLAGMYIYSCAVSDGFGGINSSLALVTATAHAPSFLALPAIGTAEINIPISIAVILTDSVTVDLAILSWSNDSGSTWHNVTMVGTSVGIMTWNFTAAIPGQAAGVNILFQVYAKDIYGSWTVTANGGKYFTIAIPGGGLEWWIWLIIIIGATVGIIAGALYLRSRKSGLKAGEKRVVTKTVLATPIGAAPAEPAATGFEVEHPGSASDVPAESAGMEGEPGVHAYRGGQIVGLRYIYKVKVKNATDDTITDVSVHLLNYPRDSMTLETEELRKVAKIEPHGFRSLEFELQPQKDCVEGQLVSAVNYMDTKNELHSVPVKPLAVKSVCDLMGPLEISEEDFDQLIGAWASTQESFPFEGEDPRALLEDVPAILGSKNFYTVAQHVFGEEPTLNAEVKAIAVGKYTKKKLALDVILEADTARAEGTILCTGLAEDPSMLVACLGEVIAELRKRLERFWDTRVAKLRDVMNIQHVLVIHKDSGTALVSRNYAGEKIDGDLISGFLTALTSFQSEISGKRSAPEGKKGFTLDYADFKILLEDGEYIRAALILESEASNTIKEGLVRFIQRFEELFQKELKAWRGKLDDIAGGENLIEDVFEMSLLHPHVVNPGVSEEHLGKFEQAIYAMGQAITKEQSFFFLATLMEYAMAGLKESQDRIFSAIYGLKQNHAIEPMSIADEGPAGAKDAAPPPAEGIGKKMTRREELLNQIESLQQLIREMDAALPNAPDPAAVRRQRTLYRNHLINLKAEYDVLPP